MVKNSIKIISCKDKKEASIKAMERLLKICGKDTLLLLSGGTSPDRLYQMIAQDETLKIGAAALVDERVGLPMHLKSNEKMIADTGLIDYFKNAKIPFYGILKEGNIESVTLQYEQLIKELFKKFPQKVAIMGIGSDGHTAGIKPGLEYDRSKWVVAYNDKTGPFGKRATLTFEALAEVSEFIILVFKEKKEALEKILQEQSQQILPAVFFKKTFAKVTIFTDIDKH